MLAAALAWPAGLSAQAAGDAASTLNAGAAVPATPPPDASTVPPSAAQTASPPPTAPPTSTGVTVARATASASKSVAIVDYSFNPGAITVDAGDTVQWTNDGKVASGHTVTGHGLNSGVLHSGSSYSFTFSHPGTFSYMCTIHPFMKGSVTVLGRSAGGSGGSSGSSGNGSSGSGAASGGSSSSAAPTGPGSESAAVGSPTAAGTGSSLPSTGSDPLLLGTLGFVLMSLGLALRILEAGRTGRRP